MWVWVGRGGLGPGEKLRENSPRAPGGRLGRPACSGRTGSRSPPPAALGSARCSGRPELTAGSSEPRRRGGGPGPDCKTEGGKKRRTNSPQRLLRPRSGRVVPVAAGMAESGQAELGAPAGTRGL